MASGRVPGASARCPITATRRTAEAARAHRPAGCSSGPAWPGASARASAPPRERLATGGNEPEGGAQAGLGAGRLCCRLDSSPYAAFRSEHSLGALRWFCYARLLKSTQAWLGCKYPSAKAVVLPEEGSLHPFKAKSYRFERALILSLPCCKISKARGE